VILDHTRVHVASLAKRAAADFFNLLQHYNFRTVISFKRTAMFRSYIMIINTRIIVLS